MGQFVTPPTIPDDTYCRRILIPNSPQWIGAVTGALMPLIYSSEWVSYGGAAPEDVAARALIMFNEYLNSGNDGECGDMACCGDTLIIYRINPDTGAIEQSSNGGSTWTPAANSLRSVLVNPIPPITSGVAATKCDAATNLEGQVEQWITQVSADFDTASNLTEFAAGVFAAILAALLLFITGGAITPLEALIIPTLGAAIAAAWGAGKVAFDSYWTTENKQKVLCAALDTIGEDGSFSDGQFTAFWNKCNSDLPPSPAKMLFMGFLSSGGAEGANVMAATGFSAAADCADCHPCDGCDLSTWFIPIDGDGYVFGVKDGSSTCNNLIIAQTVAGGDGNRYIKVFSPDEATCCTITGITISANPFGQVLSWDLAGETRGTFAHTGSTTDLMAACVAGISLKSIDNSVLTLSTAP